MPVGCVLCCRCIMAIRIMIATKPMQAPCSTDTWCHLAYDTTWPGHFQT